MRERFTDSEWQSVVMVWSDAVDRVGDADPAGEKIEVAQIVEDLILARTSNPDPLFREVAADVWSPIREEGMPQSSPEPSSGSFSGPPPPPPDPPHGAYTVSVQSSRQENPAVVIAKRTLRAKVSDEEYDSYMTAVLFHALKVAKAAGEPGREVSAEEAKALGDFASDWEIDLAPLWQRLSDWRG